MLRVAETTSIAETKAVEEKMPSGRRNYATRTMMSRTMPCNVSTCSFDIVDQKKKASVSTTIFATRMVTRHIKKNKDPASPSYMSRAARRRDHLYRREDAPLAPRRRRFLPAAEAVSSLFFFK